MRLLIAVRLSSGLRSSVTTGHWRPSGSPAIYKLIEGLHQNGHAIKLILVDRDTITDGKPQVLRLEGLDIDIQRLPVPKMFSRLPRQLQTIATELYHAFGIWRIGRHYRPDAVYLDRAMLWPAGLLARFSRWPVIWRVLGISPNLQEAFHGQRLNHKAMRWLMQSPFSSVICSRDGSGGDAWLPRLLAPQIPSAVLLNGVDQPDAPNPSAPALNIPASDTVVTFLGRLDHLKNLQLFVAGFAQAAARQPGLHALVVGNGEERAWLEQRLQSPDCSAITFIPGVPHDQVSGILDLTDIYVSLNAMGNLSNANLEAIKSGLCLVIPKADPDTARDVDTDNFLPETSALRIDMNEISLADALIHLHRNPGERIARAAETAKIGATLQTWQARIDTEIDLISDAIRNSRTTDIAFVIADLQAGGAQRVATILMQALHRRGHRISLITFSSESEDILPVAPGIRRIALPANGNSGNVFSALYGNIRRILLLRRALSWLQAPVVVSFIGSTNIVAALASLFSPWRLLISERNDPARQSLGKVWNILRRRLYPLADVITANSAGAIQNMAGWVSPDRLKLVRNPLPSTAFCAEQPPSQREQVILAVGRLQPQKGFDILIEALARLDIPPTWRLAIAGTGPLEADLKAMAVKNGVADRIDWLGFVTDMPRLYARAAIFALPSRYEGTPNALLEAMAAGCACVAADTAHGAVELIASDSNGILCRGNDRDALAAALSVLTVRPDMQDRLGAGAQATARQYESEGVVDEWEVLFGIRDSAGMHTGADRR
ncbi:MAG: glycosyltransferase [Ferrovibrio sp.]|uniref:glycosyltransferase family 4 protein n=1 Tax=Ferrovibrio sp. TaxID=1917215 RepID=UPI00262765D1|nr:glycosyltransferase [Ferrovibrio sp.]MCW0234954.1 glycosyltransferase [Ferrovibrio sp.]